MFSCRISTIRINVIISHCLVHYYNSCKIILFYCLGIYPLLHSVSILTNSFRIRSLWIVSLCSWLSTLINSLPDSMSSSIQHTSEPNLILFPSFLRPWMYFPKREGSVMNSGLRRSADTHYSQCWWFYIFPGETIKKLWMAKGRYKEGPAIP